MHRISLRAAAVCTALVLSPALALLAAPEARAGVIFQQTVPLIFGGASSDLSLPVAAADDFQLQPGASTLTGIQWWGLYNGPVATPPAVDAFTIRIFADNTGEPAAAPLFSFAAGNAVSRSDTGQDTFVNGRDVFSYAFDLAAPVVLSADTLYWLSIVNDTPSGASQLWAWSSQPGGNGLTSSSNAPWTSNGSATGFILTGDALTAVPEPASLALFGAGLAGLGLLRRRQRGA